MAVVGFVLSIFLFCIKVYEMWRARYQLAADFAWSSDMAAGNLLHIHNLTGRQIVVTYWDVFFAHGPWLERGKETKVSADWDNAVCPIPAYSTLTLTFNNFEYFNADDRVRNGRKLYVTVHAAGKWRRTIRLLPYRTSLVEAIFSRLRLFLSRDKDDAASL